MRAAAASPSSPAPPPSSSSSQSGAAGSGKYLDPDRKDADASLLDGKLFGEPKSAELNERECFLCVRDSGRLGVKAVTRPELISGVRVTIGLCSPKPNLFLLLLECNEPRQLYVHLLTLGFV